MVAFDSTILSLLIFPDADLRAGSEAEPVEYAHERVLALVEDLELRSEVVLVPAPALAEVLVTQGADVQAILSMLQGRSAIRIGTFDQRAAVELAMQLRSATDAGNVREGRKIMKGEMKFDRQIVAIAKVYGVTTIYSDDKNLGCFASSCGLQVKRVADLRIAAKQQDLGLREADSGLGDL